MKRVVAAALVFVACSAPGRAVVHEDDPRWDCASMGNRTCGSEVSS